MDEINIKEIEVITIISLLLLIIIFIFLAIKEDVLEKKIEALSKKDTYTLTLPIKGGEESQILVCNAEGKCDWITVLKGHINNE